MGDMGITLGTALSQIIANKRRVSALKSLGIETVIDALTYYPFRVTDPVPARAVREAKVGELMAFAAQVRNVHAVPMNARRGFRLEVVVDDSAFAKSRNIAGSLAHLTYFSSRKSYVDWMAGRLRAGSTVVVAGAPSEYMGQLQFTHPEIQTVAPADAAVNSPTIKYDAATITEAMAHVCRPRPIYHASSRIATDRIHETVLALLWALGLKDGTYEGEKSAGSLPAEASLIVVSPNQGEANEILPDILPESIRSERGLMHRAEAFLAIHNPDTPAAFHKGIDTLRYEEAFVCQTALLQARGRSRAESAWACPLDAASNLRDRMIDSLPFQLTQGQREVIDDIASDMSHDWPMQRLLQGEVGSGKTVVALAALLQAVGAGHQAVMVAPTLVLAEQHLETISAMVAEMGAADEVPVMLLTGGMKLAERRRVMAKAASGEPCIIIATHAAFSKTFQAPNLALAVIDEQHRFGVEQRESLSAKAEGGKTPHLLVMTATPIPRTAAMTWFADLDISTLTELPGGRKPIRTYVVNEADARTMSSMFTHLRQRIDAGERAYIVCPSIDSDDVDSMEIEQPYEEVDADGEVVKRPPAHSVAEIADRLSRLPQFKGIEFATLTGRDKDADKVRMMADFTSGATPVLVATTVIEVGVDVKQASCIVIFDADRYGLSQLHQLRGRVGRGGTHSWAFLVSRAEPGSLADNRLEVVRGTLDGAQIAQADLEFRGAGDVLGDSQSGVKSSLKLVRVVKDADLITDARARAEQLLADDSELTNEVQLAGAVLDFTRGNETFLTAN